MSDEGTWGVMSDGIEIWLKTGFDASKAMLAVTSVLDVAATDHRDEGTWEETWNAVVGGCRVFLGPSEYFAHDARKDDPQYGSDFWLNFDGDDFEAQARVAFEKLKALGVPMVMSLEFDVILERFDPPTPPQAS